jgi:hypothetical protein
MSRGRRSALPVLAALVMCLPPAVSGQGPGPSPSPSPSGTPPPEDLTVELDVATHPSFGPDELPRWQLKQNNQLSPAAFKCIVTAFPDAALSKVVLELVPAQVCLVPAPAASPSPVPSGSPSPTPSASPSPVPSPPAQVAAVRMTRNPDRVNVSLKRDQLGGDGTYCIRVRLFNGTGPIAYTQPFLLELR